MVSMVSDGMGSVNDPGYKSDVIRRERWKR
jgi:hypothetical protein